MRLISFVRDGRQRIGAVDTLLTGPRDAVVVDLAAAEPRLPSTMVELLRGGAALMELAREAAASAPPACRMPMENVRLLAPVPTPGKIVCIGLNYRAHAAEAGLPIPAEPVVFAKFANTVNGPYDPIVLPPGSDQIDYEGELGVVIGRRCRGVAAADALTYVAGYLAVNDVTARDVQMRNGQWVLGKSPDGFAPMGPALATADEIPDPQDLAIQVRVGPDVLQSSRTSDMIFPVAALVSFLSGWITLEPGDIIATGTPAGVGMAHRPPRWLVAGDTVTVEISRVGALANPVVRNGSGSQPER